MASFFAPLALVPEGWARNVRISLDGGTIAGTEPDAAPARGDIALTGRALLPAPANLHSHAFQRAMAGMTERRGRGADSFWAWRRLMYRFLDALDPDDIEAIAALVYMEMLESGYAAVAEFHYLHHAPGGTAYADPAEMSHRIAAAAAATGIGLTLLPALYTWGGADRAPLAGGQLRFGNDLAAFLRLHERAGAGLAADGRLGAAPHSLRASTPDDIRALAAALPGGPIHIHAAEQVREVEEVSAWLGARPVEFLLDRVGVGPRWCLIHATQMTETETVRLAASGATAGLCPITESNLGDGIFNGARFLAAGGSFGVGSDSNVRIALGEELRTLEYSQRLRDRARNVLAAPEASVGRTLYDAALAGGARAAGRDSGALRAGALADMLTIDLEHPVLMALTGDALLDGWIFAADDAVVRDVWSAGRHVVRDGRHVARAPIEARYRAAIKAVLPPL